MRVKGERDVPEVSDDTVCLPGPVLILFAQSDPVRGKRTPCETRCGCKVEKIEVEKVAPFPCLRSSLTRTFCVFP